MNGLVPPLHAAGGLIASASRRYLMSVKQLSGWFAAAALASVVVSAQVPAQQPPQQPEQKAPAATANETIKVVGCVQKEIDVLKRSAAATNMGMSDEYVLTESKLN